MSSVKPINEEEIRQLEITIPYKVITNNVVGLETHC